MYATSLSAQHTHFVIPDLQYQSANLKKINSRQTLTRRQSAVVILCESCITSSLLGQPKFKKFLLFRKFIKCPQTKFHTDNMSDSKVIRSKKVKIYH